MADVRLRDVHKAFGDVRVLQDINLDIANGEFVVFVGPSGCGKSTLLRVIAGLEDITAGELTIGGKRMNEIAPADRGIAMVFQSYALYPHMSLYDNMAFGLKLAKVPKAQIDSAVKHAAEILRIDHLLDRKPKALSGGQRQRVAIGRAIVRKPNVFLFDEPLSNLDAALRVKMRYEFTKLHKELKTTMIYVTHDQVEAMTLADKIVVLSPGGKIEQVGAPLDIYHFPVNKFVAGFIGSPKMNFIKGTIVATSAANTRVRLASGQELDAAADSSGAAVGDAIEAGIRPEHVRVDHGTNLLRGKVQFVEQMGDAIHAYLEYPGTDEALTVTVPAEFGIHADSEVALSIPPDRVHLFNAQGLAFKRVTPVASAA
jgi:multiple sugar transport system ATP-binding protein